MKDRKLLMIPGPIEFDPAVLSALGAPTTSHLAPNFMHAFSQALKRMRQVWLSDDGQPFILAGTGTLAMDTAGANLVEPGDKALVVNIGYFSDRYATLLERYGAEVSHVRSPVGGCPTLNEVEAVLKEDTFKLVIITHVDTSTAVIADVKGVTKLAGAYGALTIVDGVCSIAGEELRMSEWGVDVALTASQKAIGVPPGLALLVVSPRAMRAFKTRKTPVQNYYGDWNNWLPIMQAYEAGAPSYFGTPAVNMIFALNVSLGQILDEGMGARFTRHLALSRACKAAMTALGMGQVPLQDTFAANTLTAPRYPQDVTGAEFLGNVKKAGVVLAGGLHPKIKGEYFRIGHMGAANISDILGTVGAIESALHECGYAFKAGCGVEAAQQAYYQV
jgi:alanine-glyoxylate transaminase/serine-glyoxylate transaminase/serine-pyruvate transaminase